MKKNGIDWNCCRWPFISESYFITDLSPHCFQSQGLDRLTACVTNLFYYKSHVYGAPTFMFIP